MPDLSWWAWVLLGLSFSFAFSSVMGYMLKRSRERYEAEEEFWKDQTRRSRSRWN